MQRLEFHAMGCQMLAIVDSDSRLAAKQLAQVPQWFEEWEQHLSRFRESSELNELNRQSGRSIPVSPILWEVTQLAIKAAEWSDGLVSPTILNALEAAGYDRSFEAISPIGTLPTRSADPTPAGQWRAIERRASTRSIQLPSNVRIDLGGVAKGWAAARAARKLSIHGAALVDASGDIALNGLRLDGQAWPIGITDPLNPDRQLDLIMIDQGGVATSGRDYRRWQHDGQWQHHIIDPRTGLPAQTDVISATVIAPNVYQAEVAAKAAVILGSDQGLSWLEDHPHCAGLLVLEDGRVLFSERMHQYLWR
ncbi:MAG TPA: FAD:protein FMN transferase [Anaerolineae bacterium]|nr:FAD:protein FMN transferase [Anaerolineae bacterium]